MILSLCFKGDAHSATELSVRGAVVCDSLALTLTYQWIRQSDTVIQKNLKVLRMVDEEMVSNIERWRYLIILKQASKQTNFILLQQI